MAVFSTNPTWKEGGGWLEQARTADHTDRLIGHIVENVSLETAGRTNAVLVGEPTNRGRAETSHGPVTIRQALARTQAYHLRHGAIESVGDLGDVEELLAAADYDIGYTESVGAVQNRLQKAVSMVHRLETLPIFLGGNGSLTYPNVAPLLEDRRVGCLSFDSRLDVRSEGEATAETGIRQLFAEGLAAYACLGARSVETARSHHEFVREQEGDVLTAATVGEDPVGAANGALDGMDDVDTLFVSIDLGVLAVNVGPAVPNPTPGGITARELFVMLEIIAQDDRVSGLEVVGCTEPPENPGITSESAGRAIGTFLACRDSK